MFFRLVLAVLVALLLAASCKAQAQAPAVPPCMPSIYGESIGAAGVTYHWMGWRGYFFCKSPAQPDGSYTITGQYWACVNSDCDPIELAKRYVLIKMAGDQQSSASGYWNQYVVRACTAASGDFKLLCDAAQYEMCQAFPNATKPSSCASAAMPTLPSAPPPPPATTWRVLKDPFAPGGNRAVFIVVSGKRAGQDSTLSAAPGEPCDATLALIKEFAGTYVSVKGRADRVAVCEQVTQ